MSFVEKLDAESLKYFNEVAQRPFSDQAVFVLNAFYDELKDEAECIYHVAWEKIKYVDMNNKNIHYVHLYSEGKDLDFDMALYLFELLGKFYDDAKNARWREQYPRSVPKEMTAIVRKKEIREKVDVNFDGRVSFLEFLLYQYNLSPKDLMDRSKGGEPTNEALEKAKSALEDVNRKIREYEAEKARLEEQALLPGVKGLSAKNMLAQLGASPLAEELRRLLILAEAAVRIASRGLSSVPKGEGQPRTDGAVWWLNRELLAKQLKYGKKA
jgi:hypothetical protein